MLRSVLTLLSWNFKNFINSSLSSSIAFNRYTGSQNHFTIWLCTLVKLLKFEKSPSYGSHQIKTTLLIVFTQFMQDYHSTLLMDCCQHLLSSGPTATAHQFNSVPLSTRLLAESGQPVLKSVEFCHRIASWTGHLHRTNICILVWVPASYVNYPNFSE